jgi:hypothetical protein
MRVIPSRSLSDFLAAVEQIRVKWKTDDEDLWFRGEREEYGDSRLKPKLYRGPSRALVKDRLEKLPRSFLNVALV